MKRWSASAGSRPCSFVRRAEMRRAIGLLLCLSSGVARGAPTGLNTIPTGDLVPVHHFTLSLQNGNTSVEETPTLIQQPQPVFQFQFGLSPALEGGMDLLPAHPPGDYRPQFNLKW